MIGKYLNLVKKLDDNFIARMYKRSVEKEYSPLLNRTNIIDKSTLPCSTSPIKQDKHN
jgi:hypothetical protein